MRRDIPTAPDWQLVIQQIAATGLSVDVIASRARLSLRALKFLSTGVQPLYWRGQALVELWVERTRQPAVSVPVCEVIRGHRKPRQAADRSPKLQSLPNWPAPVQQTEMQGKKRRKKEEA